MANICSQSENFREIIKEKKLVVYFRCKLERLFANKCNASNRRS